MKAARRLLPIDPLVKEFHGRHGLACAVITLTGFQHWRYQALLVGLAALFCYDYKIFTAVILFALAAFYAVVGAYKMATVMLAFARRPEVSISPTEIAALAAEDLPVYTILVPLYKEPEVAAKIIRAVANLDYPPEKMDVKLLLEEDDAETIRRCQQAALPPWIEMVIVPPSFPRTKPKACNHGLARARGKYLVIYDAEDRPEPDQLKKAVIAFRRAKPDVGCLQAKLNYYNQDQNLLTRWFTLEYTVWFDLFLPGLHILAAPIPLGGTSNHFCTEVLRQIGGWDPFNLTEDCDLGIRLHRRGWRTMILDSTTWEEANSQLGNWLRQRSRWIKGYIQTHFAHTRCHLRALREMGIVGYASFIFTVGGLSFAILLNPFFWLIGLAYLGLCIGGALGLTPYPWAAEIGWRMRYAHTVSDLPGSPLTLWSQLSWVFWAVSLALAFANLFFIAVNLFACARRRLWHLVPEALFSPIYWILISAAGWKGFLQLFSRPFYWEKTQHGLLAHTHNDSPEAGVAS